MDHTRAEQRHELVGLTPAEDPLVAGDFLGGDVGHALNRHVEARRPETLDKRGGIRDATKQNAGLFAFAIEHDRCRGPLGSGRARRRWRCK